MPYQKVSICLIEDNDADAIVFRRLLRDVVWRDYEVDWFPVPSRALEGMRSYDIYVIDFSLPGSQSGIDLIRTLQSRGVTGPFILLTGKDDPRIAEETRKLGVTYYLLKEEITGSLLDRVMMHSLSAHEYRMGLEAERAYSGSVIQAVPFAIISVDPDGIISRANSYFETHLENCRPQAKDGDPAPKDGFVGWGKYLLGESLRHGDHGLVRVRCPDTYAITYWEWRLVAHLSARGELFIMENVTQRLEKDRQMRQKDKMEALGYLAGGVAHELNNSLQPLMLIGELIEDKAIKQNDAKLQNQAEIIKRHTEHGAEIVRDILDFARVEKDEYAQLPFPESLYNAVAFLRSSLPSGIKVNILPPPLDMAGELALTGSELIKIIRNILFNAADAMGGQGDVDVEWSILPVFDPHPHHVLELSVTDNGPGIDEKIAERIFDPFFTTKETGKGSGLGLSIAYNIIKTAGGSIQLENTAGRGARFTIRLPVRLTKSELSRSEPAA